MSQINTQKVTKPIQLLSAWLVGLIAINGSFLTAAANIDGWEKSLLVIAAVINVPIFLVAIFILQTKFRPELQEDSFYSKYLDSKSNRVVRVGKLDLIEKELEVIKTQVINKPAQQVATAKQGFNWGRISINDNLSDFEEIKTYFKENNIPIYDIFGKTKGVTDIPAGRYISIDHGVSFPVIVEILKLGIKFNMDGYAYYSAQDEFSTDDVLIGSYSDHVDHKFFPINEELKNLLEEKIELSELKWFEKKGVVSTVN
ncbi:hypothetical protein A7985_05520 [Pseudoalteromonas luteoviolacea]|uniref:Uncharacterized protein n=1 Tax=Pseudoalteromonas luteoviolacea TaxID=43657 RepID=A0A1C0TVR3_9GAMM|nr:hypothetical protein [Pseudoalteromonas luteoviolacea]OCQ23399.1 hypothetical protein A7985_05520 [Pseudoalteromonas luteoviolacea]